MREAVAILDQHGVDFEYDGEMSPDVALDPAYRALYPFCRLTGQCERAGRCRGCIPRTSRRAWRRGWAAAATIGPLLIGMQKAVQIAPMDSSASGLVDIACLAAHQATWPYWRDRADRLVGAMREDGRGRRVVAGE